MFWRHIMAQIIGYTETYKNKVLCKTKVLCNWNHMVPYHLMYEGIVN